MEGIFLGGSLLAAFVAGAVALFAPCCIVFMFPAYLAAAVRNRRWRLVPLTLTFGAGIALVLVPITLGIGLLTRPLLRFHGAVYGVGGLLLVVLAVFAATGKTWSLPMLKGSPDIQRTDSAGVFALGVFSGAASSCCAPVLAGVVTMSAVAPSTLSAAVIGMGYVFGMVFPLLLMTLWWDRSGLAASTRFKGREVVWSLGDRSFRTNTVNLAAAVAMAIMGAGLVVIALTGASLTSEVQAGMASWIQGRLAPVVRWLEPIPNWITALGLVGLAVAAISISGRRRPTLDDPDDQELDNREGHCHDQADDEAQIAGAGSRGGE
jgi:cytochrome c biogenesis protein CcdA